ncbi:MAG: hypothetical protein HY719_17300, partial [Planctomycetes bacterium]|nr:hypothetical protein [Planctomycetota bacterium]
MPLVLYSAPAVMRACQAFLDRWFVRLDDDPADAARALVSVRPRGGDLSDAALLHVLDEWFGELLNVELRDDLQATVGRLREIIVGRALHAARPDPWTAQDAGGEDWLEDPLGIAVPWEQKYGKGKKGGEWTYMSGAAGDHPPSDAEQ